MTLTNLVTDGVAFGLGRPAAVSSVGFSRRFSWPAANVAIAATTAPATIEWVHMATSQVQVRRGQRAGHFEPAGRQSGLTNAKSGRNARRAAREGKFRAWTLRSARPC